MSDEPDVSAKDALAVAQRALSKANDLESLQGEVDELRERVVALELRLSEYDEDTDYRDLTLNDKIGMVREHGFEKAQMAGGRAKLDYDDIMWEVFDGNPGTKHCYKLMRKAAEGMDGFQHRDPDSGSQHLAIDAKRTKKNIAFSREQSSSSKEGLS